MNNFLYGKSELTTRILIALSQKPSQTIALHSEITKRIDTFRKVVETAVASKETFYGINTGFGLLSDVKISHSDLNQLQLNLIRSHACGVGDIAPIEFVRSLLHLRLHTFCLGHSGVSSKLVQHIAEFLKLDIIPVIPVQGSVGASGDLAPLAHMALSFVGEGEVFYKNVRRKTAEVLEELQLKPVILKPKEGLSLINGTLFMAALGSHCVEQAEIFATSAKLIFGLSLDAMRGSLTAFSEKIHNVRVNPIQQEVAKFIRNLFSEKDEILQSHENCGKVQDPYSFRCMPQVHGAFEACLEFTRKAVDQELNSVTDNPIVFESGEILSGGNFHGQCLAQAMDFLAISLTDIGSMVERRIEKLTNPQMSGLPAFLTKNSGLNSGFMMPHVTAAALCSENKIYAHPASVDSIPTSADKEDHVSMGPAAATKCLKILKNNFRILAIEAMASCQGIDLLSPLQPNPTLKKVYNAIRSISGTYLEDRSLSQEIETLAEYLEQGELLTCLK